MNSRQKLPAILLLSIFFALLGCNNMQDQTTTLTPHEGYVHVKGGKIWYRIEGGGDKTPLLLLHGGPGAPSYYLNPIGALSKDRPIIFYDQLGCGRSDRITDTALMTIPEYVNNLEVLVDSLHLKNYYIYGHSWGTILATEFYLKHPKGIQALVMASPALDIPRWERDADTLISVLPDSVQEAIKVNEENKTYDSPSYQQAVMTYYQNYVARRQPWSPDMDSTMQEMGQGVYMYMEGPSEFTFTGTLKGYDITGRLGEIKVPTLFICGEYDEAMPSTVKYYQSLVPGAQFSEIPGAGHLTMQDNPADNNEAIELFLENVEKK